MQNDMPLIDIHINNNLSMPECKLLFLKIQTMKDSTDDSMYKMTQS